MICWLRIFQDAHASLQGVYTTTNDWQVSQSGGRILPLSGNSNLPTGSIGRLANWQYRPLTAGPRELKVRVATHYYK